MVPRGLRLGTASSSQTHTRQSRLTPPPPRGLRPGTAHADESSQTRSYARGRVYSSTPEEEGTRGYAAQTKPPKPIRFPHSRRSPLVTQLQDQAKQKLRGIDNHPPPLGLECRGGFQGCLPTSLSILGATFQGIDNHPPPLPLKVAH